MQNSRICMYVTVGTVSNMQRNMHQLLVVIFTLICNRTGCPLPRGWGEMKRFEIFWIHQSKKQNMQTCGNQGNKSCHNSKFGKWQIQPFNIHCANITRSNWASKIRNMNVSTRVSQNRLFSKNRLILITGKVSPEICDRLFWWGVMRYLQNSCDRLFLTIIDDNPALNPPSVLAYRTSKVL